MVITDLVCRDILEQIAYHKPERGGALYGPKGYPLVTHFEYDPEAETSPASYIPSTRLIASVPRVERTTGLQFKGIIHSHPTGYTRPSGGDERTVASFFRLNPHFSSLALPIVQQVPREYSADHGDSAGYMHWYRAERRSDASSASRTGMPSLGMSFGVRTVEIVCEEHFVVPLFDHVTAICNRLKSQDAVFDVNMKVQHLKIANAELFGLVVNPERVNEFMFFITLDYPAVAPLVLYRRLGETRTLMVPWNGIENVQQSLGAIAESLAEEWSLKVDSQDNISVQAV